MRHIADGKLLMVLLAPRGRGEVLTYYTLIARESRRTSENRVDKFKVMSNMSPGDAGCSLPVSLVIKGKANIFFKIKQKMLFV